MNQPANPIGYTEEELAHSLDVPLSVVRRAIDTEMRTATMEKDAETGASLINAADADRIRRAVRQDQLDALKQIEAKTVELSHFIDAMQKQRGLKLDESQWYYIYNGLAAVSNTVGAAITLRESQDGLDL